MSTFPDLLFCDTVIVAHGMKEPSQHEMLRRALTSALAGVDVSVVAPTVPEYGTHHSKVFVLQYERGIRIVIHTANLVYPDFCNKSQSVYYQDFPLKTATEGEGDEGNGNADADERPQDFEAQLLAYVDHLSLPAAAASQLKDVIRLHDYTYARGRLAVSVPSKPWEHKDGDYMAFGHHRVRKILQEERAAAGFEDWYESAPVVAQGSSLGSLSARYVDDLLASFAPGSSKDDVALELIWPTVSEVQHAIDGWFGGGSVCATSERVNKARQICKLHKWGGEVTGRQRALPHMKTYLRYTCVGDDEVRLPWVFLSSMNASKAALGEAVNSKKYGAQLFRVLSFEMGIVLLPRYELAWRRSAWFGWSCTDASGRSRARGQRKPDAVRFVQWSKSAAQSSQSSESSESSESDTPPSPCYMDEGSNTLVVPIPLPFSLPPRPYPPATTADGYQDTPWSQPTELANVWHGKDMLGNLYPGRGSYQGLVQKGTSESLWWDMFSS